MEEVLRTVPVTVTAAMNEQLLAAFFLRPQRSISLKHMWQVQFAAKSFVVTCPNKPTI
jgi:hypothetical protein